MTDTEFPVDPVENSPEPDTANEGSSNPFEGVHEHDSIPSIQLSLPQKIRFTQIAKDLEDAHVQAYIEANFGIKALELLQTMIPIFAGLL